MALTATLSLEEVEDDVGLLTVIEGPDAGLSIALGDAPIRVGTVEAADLRLSDRAVSRLHCELTRSAKIARVVDLGSKNGTWISGCRVRDADVAAGMRVRIGGSALELRVDRRRVRRPVWTGGDRFGELVGRSPVMQRLFTQLARMADAPAPVLIRGDTGTGKEEVARSLYSQGTRARGPFVVIDGGALSRTLADSELFGHVRGAFTGAADDRAGAFERAHGGTLFLDEIGELPLELQPKLLRAIDRGEVRRVGGSELVRVDVRVIAATHRPVDRMVNEGSFREDLFHRLCVFDVRLPPLRERAEDVALIAHDMLARLGTSDPAAANALDRALAVRAGYAWPGNVRELRSFVRRLVVLGDAATGAPPSDGSFVRVDLPWKDAKHEWTEALERQYFALLLGETGGNVSEAARRAGIDRNHLVAIANRHGLRGT